MRNISAGTCLTCVELYLNNLLSGTASKIKLLLVAVVEDQIHIKHIYWWKFVDAHTIVHYTFLVRLIARLSACDA